jgi:hypothetical protein
MKNICIVAVALLLAACSAHRIRCRGALQPINKPVAVQSQSQDASTEPRP